MSKAVADAAANLAKNDPEIVQRAAHALLSKELRHQSNKERVARKTLEDLAHEPQAETTKPEDDWFNVFERYAEDASSERLQSIWGRILAGQLRKPKAFSLQTLRFISELDEQTVALFEKWAPYVINADFIPNPPKQGAEFTEFLELESCGLMTGVGGNLAKMFDLKLEAGETAKTVAAPFHFKDHQLKVFLMAPCSFSIPNFMLTRVGREIFPITTTPGALEPVKAFADWFPKENVERIICVPKGQQPMELWAKPAEPTPSA